MKKLLKKILFGVVVFAAVATFSVAFAQDEGGPSQAEIDAEAAKHGPSADEMQQFERQFGGPPESFPKPEISKPEFEQPGKIPDEVKKYVGDKELVAVYCAMTKWKSGQFFSAMEAVKQFVIAPTEQVKNDFSLDITIPNVDSIVAEGQRRVEGICAAKTSDEADTLANDFNRWGHQDQQGQFDEMRTKMQEQLQVKGEALREKVKNELQPFIDEQKASIEKEIKADVDGIVSAKKSEIQERLKGSKSAPDVEALKAEIGGAVEAGIKSKIERKKSEVQAKVGEKVESLIGAEKAKFEKIGERFQNVDGKINDYIKSNESKYEKYKAEAFALRKEMVLNILDKNLAEGIKKIDAAAADLDEAKKNDPSVKSAGEIKAALAQDRNALADKLDAALEAGDENAFQQALNDFKLKWEAIQANGEKAMQQSVTKVCTVALAQFGNAKKQMEPGVKKIKDTQAKCANSVEGECVQINGYSSRFETILSKFADLNTEMSLAAGMCQNPDTADRKNLISLMNKIQSDAEDAKIYGQALEAEKNKTMAGTAALVCAQAMPQLAAAQTEVGKNDLVVLQNNINKCKGKSTKECVTVNGLTGEFAQLKSGINSFNQKVEKARTLCTKAAGEEDFKTLSDTLNSLKADSQDLRSLAGGLQVKQSEQMSEVILCRSVVPETQSAKQQISSRIGEMNSIRSGCIGRSDERCKVISANIGKFNNLEEQSKKLLTKIADVNTKCAAASPELPGEALVGALDAIAAGKTEIEKLVADIRTLEAEAGKNAGITIEAEDESSSSLLPKTESWHSSQGKAGEGWRPAMFGTGYWYLSRGGESLSYNFTAAKEGKYKVWVRDYVDNFQPRGVRRITVSFDGKSYGTFGETSAPVPSGNKIGVFAWHKVGDGVTLKAGSHGMKVVKEATTAGAAILDSFYLTTGSEVPPEK